MKKVWGLLWQIILKRMYTESIEHTFMKYPSEAATMREERLADKSLEEVRGTTLKVQEIEYDILCYAQMPQSVFYLKNTKMNRYSDIWAYDHSRIKLPQIGNNYYINANEIKSLVDSKVFAIFSQAPVAPHDNFWEAVYYKDVPLVIMLCMFVDPRRGRQSEPYWPQQGKTQIYSEGKLKVTNQKRQAHDQEYVETIFTIDGPDGIKKLRHLHWMGWSDLKKPVEHKMDRFEEIISTCLKMIEENKLIWIHCSAGIGRTGTLGGILEAIRLYEQKKAFSIFKIVQNMRKYRYHAVQTEEQYRFLYTYLAKRLS